MLRLLLFSALFLMPQIQGPHRKVFSSAAPSYTVSDIGNCSISVDTPSPITCTISSAVVPSGTTDLVAVERVCRDASGCQSANYSTVTFAVTDTSSPANTWSTPSGSCANKDASSRTWATCIAVAHSPTVGTYNFTLTVSASGVSNFDFFSLHVLATTGTNGLDTASPNIAIGSSASASVTTGTLSQGSEFVVGVGTSANALTAGQTHISGSTFNSEWTTGPSSGTQALSWTLTSAPWSASAIALAHP